MCCGQPKSSFLPMNTICMFGDKGRLEKRHGCKTWWSIIDVLGLFCGSGVLSCILLNNRMSWWPLSRQKVTTQKCTCIQNNRYDCRRKKKKLYFATIISVSNFFSVLCSELTKVTARRISHMKNLTYLEMFCMEEGLSLFSMINLLGITLLTVGLPIFFLNSVLQNNALF